MRGIFFTRRLIFTFVFLFLSIFHSPLFAASDEDLQTLGMYYQPDDLVVTATRNPKPISQTAENITVVTAKEIEMMGAHTLVDVFSNVTGIQTADMGGPGLFNGFSIDGSDFNHILVMLDGVTLNLYGSPFVDISGVPVQNIERIEIVKGPGSSSWGSALGAVINIVTKSPQEGRYLRGRLSSSVGERGTRENSGEFSGTVGPLGYYLFGRNMRSNGFRDNSDADQNDIYGKLRLELPKQGSLQYTIAYDRGLAGEGEDNDWKFRRHYFLSTLSLNQPLTDSIDLDLSLRTSLKKIFEFSQSDTSDNLKLHEESNGGSIKLTWRGWKNTLAAGADYDHLNLDWRPWFQRITDKYGVFLNDTIFLGDFSVTPGFRYDRMRPLDDFFSPSLGITWNPTDKVTLRAYTARGYSLPLLCPVYNANATQARVMTVQAGFETTYIPWLWLKGTFFWNNLSDVEYVNYSARKTYLKKQLKQGVEVEGKSVPVFNTYLSASYSFIDSKDRETGETLKKIPRHIVKLGIHYDDSAHSLRGSLLGRYGWLNMPSSYNGKYTAIIWDLNLAKQLFRINNTDLELFFSAHNLFNGAQYSSDSIQNARRWFEGGLRFNF